MMKSGKRLTMISDLVICILPTIIFQVCFHYLLVLHMLDGTHSIQHQCFRAYASMLLNRHFNPQLRILSIMASNQRNIITTLCMMASNTMHDNMGTKLDNVDNKSSLSPRYLHLSQNQSLSSDWQSALRT